MATIISNQATISYRFGARSATAVSNVASTALNSPLCIEKTSLSETFRIGQNLTYIITITNNSNTDSSDISVFDDLGSFMENGSEITPLTFSGSAQLFINGRFDSVLTADASENGVIFEIDSIPANGNAQIIYLASVNRFASGESGTEITNTAEAVDECDCPCDDSANDSFTVTAEEYADVRITKTICPNPVVCGGEVRFVFDVCNYGNIDATEVILNDTFIPPLDDISVYIDGVLIPEGDYDYDDGVLTLPNESGDEITVPAAEFARNASTGVVTVTPGKIQIAVTGTI